ncbi:hypothetical protein phi16_gp019 [Corynebacterium phage phi16]|uniref:hypothetical protein n=1 Tax=Corynebacterium glutamicum TaxID=1718 RepID=UPI0009441B0A|nr:hypothetical protein [Corynebacterium glutamicum]APQ42524.1 hypothetical protein phi16_gp019 [Corynebacterium phage phi16]OKX80482.1 hypothetical protein AUO95_10015 [Corynebacterium glutamicum]
MVTLIADGGSLTTARQTANYVFGSWQVSAPDGIEQIVPDETRNNGYIYRPDDAPRGRFDLAFVRQDATIELNYITAEGETSGRSDVELQMEAGQERSKGRVLVEHEISASGLGRLRPGVDINLYDIVTVSFWGMLIDLPVTALDWTEEGVKLRVGGQLIHDPEMLRSLTSEVVQQLDAERRRSEKETAQLAAQAVTDRQQTQQISQIASSASSTANGLVTVTDKQTQNLGVTYEMLLGLRNFAGEMYEWRNGQLTDTQFRMAMLERRTYFQNTLNTWYT